MENGRGDILMNLRLSEMTVCEPGDLQIGKFRALRLVEMSHTALSAPGYGSQPLHWLQMQKYSKGEKNAKQIAKKLSKNAQKSATICTHQES